jgi:hypothetical protein
MYLHECYVVPKAALVAVVKYLRKRPFEDVAGLLAGLDGAPEGTSAELVKAKVEVHQDDYIGLWQYLQTFSTAADPPTALPLPGETVVDLSDGAGRRE